MTPFQPRAGRPAFLFIMFALLGIMTTGCTNDGTVKKWEDSIHLRPKETARIFVDSPSGEYLIVNGGPATVEMRIPAVGVNATETPILPSGASNSAIFYDHRSIAFLNRDTRREAVVHVRFTGEAMRIETMQSRRIRETDPLPEDAESPNSN